MQNTSSLEQLQREKRRWKISTTVLALVCIVVLLSAFDYPQPSLVKARSVEAQSFVLRDVDGHIWARMAISGDGPQLIFFNEHGNVISSLPLKAEIRPAR